VVRGLHILRRWLPLALVIVFVSGLLYVTVQQSLRMGANDPQIQMAEDAAVALAAGANPQSVLTNTVVDISTSLAPFLVIYNINGKPLASSGLYHGVAPLLPEGVFTFTRQNGEDRVSWQPEPGVRAAVVVVAYAGSQPGFVMAGRSLREVEIRETNLEKITGIAMLLALAGLLFVIVLLEFWQTRTNIVPN
jgi:hypothetical protein